MTDRVPPHDDTNHSRDDDTTRTDSQRTRPMPVHRDDDTAPAAPSQPANNTSTVDTQARQAANFTPEPPRRQPQRPARRGYPPRPSRQPANRDSALYLPWWSLVLMVIGVLVIAVGLVGLVYFLGNRMPAAANVQPTPIIRIITSSPNDNRAPLPQMTAQPPSTEIISGGDAPGSLSLQGPTLEAVQFTPTPAPITLDRIVIVDGVGDQELNVRDAPNITTSTVVFRVPEGDRFQVVDGPQQGDGFTWWRIQDSADPTRSGWAVANYLLPVSSQ